MASCRRASSISSVAACSSLGFRLATSPMREPVTEPWVQLATRIPKSLRLRLKLHCVEHESSVMDFIVAALREKLTKPTAGRKRSGRSE